MHHPITMIARENLKLHMPVLGYLWMPFVENEMRKILPPREDLVRRQQDAAVVEILPHPSSQDVL